MIFDKANEALKNWKSLLPMLKPLIKSETKNAVRRKKMNVATAPNGTTIGVSDPADTTVINIPYQPACANVSVGQSVWVEWLYDNFSTAIAVTPGDGIVKNITLQDGNYYIYDSNGVRRVTISSSGNIMLRNGNGDTTVLIRGDGSSSSNPLPVNQGGTGQITQFPKIRYVDGYIDTTTSTATGYKEICSTSLPAGYSYMIFGFVWTNDGSNVLCIAETTGATYNTATRTYCSSGQGVLTYSYLSSQSSDKTITLRTYHYDSKARRYLGRMMIYQFPAMPTF